MYRQKDRQIHRQREREIAVSPPKLARFYFAKPRSALFGRKQAWEAQAQEVQGRGEGDLGKAWENCSVDE